MPKTITFDPMSVSSIAGAVEELRNYQQWVEQKARELAEALSRVGIYEASYRFAGAMYDGANDVYLESTGSGNSYTITAHGQAVAFIEFGAGVYYNSGDYPLPKPEGIVGIGEYRKGNGRKQGWVYPEENGFGSNGRLVKPGWVFTRGNPQAMPMYYASKEMQEKLLTVAREVFGS